MSRFGVGFHGYNLEIAVPGNDAYTKVLLHMDGLNGGTSFPDVNAGGGAHTWTATNATTSAAQKKYGSASMLAASGMLSTPASSDFNLGSGSWTFDFWINRNGNTGQQTLLYQIDSVGVGISMQFNASNLLQVSYVWSGIVGSFSRATSSIGVSDSNWHHVAGIRSGPNLYAAVDGVMSSPSVNSDPIPNLSGNLTIGSSTPPSFIGLIDEFRMSVGIARWTGNFTPPTGPYI